MGRAKKFDYQPLLENLLRTEPEGLALDELLARGGLDVDRSTLFRQLKELIDKGRVVRIGKARASRYRTVKPGGADIGLAPSTAPELRAPRLEASASQTLDEAPAVPADPPEESASSEPAVAPDPGFDTAVKKAVRVLVRDWRRCDERNLRIYLSLLLKPGQVEPAAAAVKLELTRLHEGNLAEYGLSHAEYVRYLGAVSGAGGGK